MGFSIPASLPIEKAQELLGKAVHLTEGQRQSAMQEYLEAQVAPKGNAASGFVKNPIPWTPMGGPVSQADVLAKVASKELDIKEAARLLASNGGLKIRYNPMTGTVSVKNAGQFPWASLYRDQWERLLAMADDIRAYISENDAEIEQAELVGKAAKAAA